MHELVNTRHNELIDPLVNVWGWQIAVYLFLGGLVAGMMIIAGYFLFSGRNKGENCACFFLPLLSMALLSIGMLALFLDLEHKLYVWRLYLTFQVSSPMSWGAWILILVYPALLANLMVKPPNVIASKFIWLEKISGNLNRRPFLVKIISVANMLLGGMLGIYTGVLLSTLSARPLWNSSLLWLLFLVSGLSSAAAFVHMIAKDKDERELLAKADNGFLVLEMFVIALLIIGLLTSSQAGSDAARIILSGPYAASFWVFVILSGIVIPLILQFLAVNHRIRHSIFPPIMVIAGGLILRFIIVFAGQYSHWNISDYIK